MDRMKGTTLNIELNNIDKIKELFPEIIIDGKVNFDKLKLILGGEIDSSDERYQFTWNGKNEALKLSQTMSTGSLLPSTEDSKNLDTTQNLYIEGDNLEVLKIIQKSYYNKIKMIYIDPPYNTGNDFVYKDDFANNIKNYKEQTSQSNRANPETSGRYHTDWLNMMYPRLRLARNLLTEDGVIFISIDDNEQANLKKICDEIFGESNFVINFIWEKGKEGGNDSSIMRSHYDNILCYCKDFSREGIINLDQKDVSRHISVLPEDNLVFGIENEINKGELFQLINLSKQKDYTVKIILKNGDTLTWPSYAPQKTIDEWIKCGKIFVGSNKVPYVKSFLKDELQGQKPSNIIDQKYGTTKAGSIEIRSFFGSRELFSYPKPSLLIKRILKIGSRKNSIILDFFSGSATTAHAVMQLNSEDGGNRKFIMVQLPEKCDESSEAYKSGYENICEIGKERIRRAGEKIKVELAEKSKQQSLLDGENVDLDKLDIGFKVFKLDSSNIKTWDSSINSTDQLSEQLNLFIDPVKEDRTKEDVLYEIILKQGLSLTSPIENINIKNETVFSIGKGYMIICLSNKVNLEIVEEIGKLKPQIVIFKDSGFETENIKLNADQILKRYGVDKENIKTI
jgi:adenine-specific DNA-methyltransferase